MTTSMLRQAVRTVLAEAGDRTPSPDAWGLVLMAAGVEPTKAAGLPARLGCVFHLGRWREQDVVMQLRAWGDALRVRAEPEVAAVVDRAAAALAAEVSATPLPDPETAPPAAAPAPHAPPPRPTPRQHLPTPSSGPAPTVPPSDWLPGSPQAFPPQGAPVPQRRPRGEQRGQQRRLQQPPQQRPPAGPPAPQRPQSQQRPRPQGKAPRSNRWVVAAGLVLVLLLCGCGVLGLVSDLFSGNG